MLNRAIVRNGNKYVVCNQNYALFKCSAFSSKPVQGRFKTDELNKLSENYLLQNPKVEYCMINVKYKNCSQKQYTLLHVFKTSQTNREFVINRVSETSVYNGTQCHSCIIIIFCYLLFLLM